MHSSRMRTIHCSGRLSCHTCPLPTTHTHCHAHPLPHMPACQTHAACHAHVPYHTCHPAIHACLPHMPPAMHMSPTTHAPLPCMLPPLLCVSPHMPLTPLLWTEFLTHACENTTFPQLLLQTVTPHKSAPLSRLV